MQNNRPSMHEIYLKMAKLIATRSTCMRQQNGAVITSIDMRRVLAIGYNGAPHNAPHCIGGDPGDCGCIHAELNAMLKIVSPEPSIMFITTSPCMNCAKAIMQTNIQEIYYLNTYRDETPIEYILKYSKILIHKLLINETLIKK